MKLYTYDSAPNPQRVRFFLVEKGLDVASETVDLATQTQLSDAYRAINDRCDVPFLVLDDGTGIGEVEAICRYLEEIQPRPPLFGRDPVERARVAMWTHRMEAEGLQAGMEAYRNGHPWFAGRGLVGPRGYSQIPDLAERGRRRVEQFFESLDRRLAEVPHVAGAAFSIADITAYVSLDFAARARLRPAESLSHLARWREAVGQRPGAAVCARRRR